MLRCPHRIGRKRCRGIIERGMPNCHECGGDLEGVWKEVNILVSPGAGLPPPRRRPRFGRVQRLGKKFYTHAGVEVSPDVKVGFGIDVDELEKEIKRMNRPRQLDGDGPSEGPLIRIEHWQDGRGQPKDLGEAWRLTKGGRVARCVLVGHPLGQEARIIIDDEDFPITQVCKNTGDVANVTAEWREGFINKGWKGIGDE